MMLQCKLLTFTDGIMSGFKDILRETTLSSVPSTRAVMLQLRAQMSSKKEQVLELYGDDDIVVDGGTQGIRIGDIVVGAGIPAGSIV